MYKKYIFSILLFFFPILAFAAVDSVVIVEVVYDAGAGSDQVRIYNPTDKDVDFTSWTLQDSSSNNLTLPANLSAGAYSTIAATSLLNNAGDGVLLRDASSNLIDSVYYEGASSGWNLETSSTTQFLCRNKRISEANDDSEWRICDTPDTFGSREYVNYFGKKSGLRFGCKDESASNYTRFARHRQEYCVYGGVKFYASGLRMKIKSIFSRKLTLFSGGNTYTVVKSIDTQDNTSDEGNKIAEKNEITIDVPEESNALSVSEFFQLLIKDSNQLAIIPERSSKVRFVNMKRSFRGYVQS